MSRRVALGLLVFALVVTGCAGLRRLGARPAEYAAYREVRTAETVEERLTAAHAYLNRYPGGVWTEELGRWYRAEEARYWAESYDSLPRLRAYLAALPQGLHHGEVARRVRELELAREYAREREQRFELRAREIAAELDAAQRGRQILLVEVTRFIQLLAGIRTWGAPTSELDSTFLHHWRILRPMARCVGGRCAKTLSLDYAVPEAGALSSRQAIFDVVVELERGRVARAVLTGPELWNRVAEAVSLRPVAPDDPLARLEAVAVALTVAENALERVLPAARCATAATSPTVLVRTCDGVRVTMIAAPVNTEEDRVVVEPVVSEDKAADSGPGAEAGIIAPPW
ncbi:MAG: hypothetical protein JW751_22385 [Polyangiaceae bacterium]|nr:hypothetical protein [Polyangiaceae bacterium]